MLKRSSSPDLRSFFTSSSVDSAFNTVAGRGSRSKLPLRGSRSRQLSSRYGRKCRHLIRCGTLARKFKASFLKATASGRFLLHTVHSHSPNRAHESSFFHTRLL